METVRPAPASIDEYIAGFPFRMEETRRRTETRGG
jgi:hypothetical protein